MIPPLRRLFPALLLFPLAAQGTIVTTTTDEDNGFLGGGTGISLREAVKYSPAGTTISFKPLLSGQIIRLTLGEITVTNSLTIDGSALPAKITLSGDRTGNGRTPDDSRVFRIDDKAVSLDSLILSASANQTYGGGAIYASGHSVKLTVTRCTFIGNHGNPEGGAIYFYGAYQAPETVLTVLDSTFSGNSSTDFGGAIYAFGILNIRNSTLTANTTKNGGAVYVHFNTNVLIYQSTLTGNTATLKGGCIYNSGSITMRNSIIAGNISPTFPGIYGSFGNDNNITSGTPFLAPLGHYGGTTQTMPPLPGSPAINNGTTTANSLFPSLTNDQRGFPRVSFPDIGAAEYQGNSDLTRFWKLDFDGDGSPYGTEQALGTDSAVADSANSRHLTTPAFNASGHTVLSFGIAPAAPGTRWILRRSTDLLTFSEIYRYDGTADTAAPDITFVRTATCVTITDTNPPPGGGFYRFEARLEP